MNKMHTLKRFFAGLVVVATLAAVTVVAVPRPAHAQIVEPPFTTGGSCNPAKPFFSFPTWYQYLDTETVSGKCVPKLDLENKGLVQIALIGVAILEMLLRAATFLAIGYVIFGGIRMIISQGDPERIRLGRNTAINGIIGLVISLVAAGLVSFVAGRF